MWASRYPNPVKPIDIHPKAFLRLEQEFGESKGTATRGTVGGISESMQYPVYATTGIGENARYNRDSEPELELVAEDFSKHDKRFVFINPSKTSGEKYLGKERTIIADPRQYRRILKAIQTRGIKL